MQTDNVVSILFLLRLLFFFFGLVYFFYKEEILTVVMVLRNIMQNLKIRPKESYKFFGLILEHCLTGLRKSNVIF